MSCSSGVVPFGDADPACSSSTAEAGKSWVWPEVNFCLCGNLKLLFMKFNQPTRILETVKNGRQCSFHRTRTDDLFLRRCVFLVSSDTCYSGEKKGLEGRLRCSCSCIVFEMRSSQDSSGSAIKLSFYEFVSVVCYFDQKIYIYSLVDVCSALHERASQLTAYGDMLLICR